METQRQPPPADEVFLPSRKSQSRSARIGLWAGFALGAAAIVFVSGGISFLTILILLLFVPLEWYLRTQASSRQAQVTLTADAVESRNISGRSKRLLWRDIEEVSVAATQGLPIITFHLRASAGIANKRNFWTGENYSRPALTLTPYARDVQEQLVDAIHRRLQRVDGVNLGTDSLPPNPLKEDRVFEDRVKALAPQPWVTYALIGFNVLVWVISLWMGADVLRTPTGKLLQWGGNAASEVQRGDWWRLVTAMFLHSSILHLVMNMFGLALVGAMVERVFGAQRYVLLYVGAGVIGAAASLHFGAQRAVSVGASGAVFGVMGALLIAVFRHRATLPKRFRSQMMSGMAVFILYSLAQGFKQAGVDNAAHVGGLFGGCLLAAILPVRFSAADRPKGVAARTAITVIVMTAVAIGLVRTAPDAAVDIGRLRAEDLRLEQSFQRLVAAMKAIDAEQREVAEGKLSEREADERSRAVHAPVFRQLTEELLRVKLPPGDTRQPMLAAATRTAELMTEALAMESVWPEGSSKPEPADPERSAEIEAELKEMLKRTNEQLAALKKRR